MLRSTRRWRAWAATGALVLLGSCNESPVDLPTPTSLVVSPAQLTLYIGEFAQVTAQVLDQNGKVMPVLDVIWSSDNGAVAYVSSAFSGRATVSTEAAGTANLNATYGSLTGTVPVTVLADDRLSVSSFALLADTVRTDVNRMQDPEVEYRVFDVRGTDRCAATGTPTPLFRSDLTVATAFALGGSTCRIRIIPFGAGATWLVASVHNAKDSVWVIVSNLTFNARFSQVPHDTLLVAGTTQGYEVTVTDKADQPVQGVKLNFDVEGGALTSAVLTTGANGKATANWRYPQTLPDPPGVCCVNFFQISFEASYTPPGHSGPIDVGGDSDNREVLAGPATSVVLIADFDDDGTEETLGTAASIKLGFDRDLFAQSFDQYGNIRYTTGVFSSNDPEVIGSEFPDGTRKGVGLVHDRPKTATVTATEGTGSASVAITWVAGPEMVFTLNFGATVWTGQIEDIFNPPEPGDTLVYDGLSGSSDFPVFTLRGDTVAFVWLNGGFRDVALVRSNGLDAASPSSTIPAAYRASALWGFPVFRSLANNPAGGLVFLSNRDGVAGDVWDVFTLDRSVGTPVKVTNTSVDSTQIVYHGLSLSPDGSKVLIVSETATNPGDGSTRFSQVYEVTLATGAIVAVTANASASIEFRHAAYSPDGSKVYIDRESGACQLVEKDGANFRVLRQAANCGELLQPTFHPTDANVLAYWNDDFNEHAHYFPLNQATNLARDVRGRGNIENFSWSKR